VPSDQCYGINDHGPIVGSMQQGSPPYATTVAFLYQKGTVTSLNPPGATSSVAYGINNPGTIVGDYTNTSGISNAFWLYHGKLPFKIFSFAALGLDGQVTLTGINNNGTFEGQYTDTITRRFLSNNNGPPVTIGTLIGSTALVGVNVHGEVAGNYIQNGVSHAFIVENGISKEIKFPGATATKVTGIDDWGNVAGTFISPYQTGTFVRWVHCTPLVGCQ